jgi:hypothetical protein
MFWTHTHMHGMVCMLTCTGDRSREAGLKLALSDTHGNHAIHAAVLAATSAWPDKSSIPWLQQQQTLTSADCHAAKQG